ncbi:MAG: helix-turn-helix transcriptional regulator [Flavobacteriaceae bacterium]|nr:helix-turn-helix transcriptional regulator [Flavobacteriaceae bacterium]
MQQNTFEIAVKNMVCNRCIKVVKDELFKNKIVFSSVVLGKIFFETKPSEKVEEILNKVLRKEGFELVENRSSKIINQIKTLIIKNIHYGKVKSTNQIFSTVIALSIGIEYSQLSKLFSEIEGKTIEHYCIEQRIERTKELLIYDELTLSQISHELNYSSPQHLSRQFKKITGLTPTQFKSFGKRKTLDTI